MKNRFEWSSVVLAAVVFSAACSSAGQKPDGQFERVSAGLIFDGDLNSSNIEYLIESLKPNDVLIINSAGGGGLENLKLSSYIVRNKISIVVNGECAGACAFYTFLPARTRKVAVGASLRFDRSPLNFYEKPVSARPALTAAEREAYRKILSNAGVSEGLLSCTDRALATQVGVESQVGGSAKRANPERYAEVAVSRDVLTKYGVLVEGQYEWPDDPEYWNSYRAEFSPLMTRIDSPTFCE